MTIVFKPLEAEAMSEILRIQETAYEPRYQESEETILSKIEYSPGTSIGAYEDGKLVGYALAFPWGTSDNIPLNFDLADHSPIIDTLYVHDVSVDSSHRGRGIGSHIVQHLFEKAEAMDAKSLTLVAVQDAKPFWESRGFEALYGPVEGYGSESVKMRKFL